MSRTVGPRHLLLRNLHLRSPRAAGNLMDIREDANTWINLVQRRSNICDVGER